MNTLSPDEVIASKMRAAGVAGSTIAAFLAAVRQVRAGERGLVPESAIEPPATLPRLEALAEPDASAPALLRQLAVIKLNGGLGTGMGLERTKSLIAVKGAETFLDFIARQILHLRAGRGREPAFYLMDSFTTQRETLGYLSKFAELAGDGRLDFLQSMVPKLEVASLTPIAWPAQPDLEWCPPGHGDLYPSILGCGLLDDLLARGIRHAFVSNADNLGATVDLKLLHYFAQSGLSFLMEVAERTAADRKGGHLARRRAGGRLLLRESAQCPEEDEAHFQDIQRHRFFNTNNLWIRLDHLRQELDRREGVLPLPLITNAKTVDPRDPQSPKVLQLESAMGAAIECFDHAGAVVVPRSRFAPVKATSDLLALRSDAYIVTPDFRLVLDPSRQGRPPVIDLDARHYRLMAQFEAAFPEGAPSLRRCDRLLVTGLVRFDAGVICEGAVEFASPSSEQRIVRAGLYRDVKVVL